MTRKLTEKPEKPWQGEVYFNEEENQLKMFHHGEWWNFKVKTCPTCGHEKETLVKESN